VSAWSARACLVVSVCAAVLSGVSGERHVTAQSAAKIDFARDVQPILRQHCIGCHGPTQQQAGYRLDRRREALSGTLRPLIIPGSSESSRLYRRISGSEFGTQMPPTESLSPRDIETIKAWIDEGAPWPDALANDAPTPAPDPGAVRLSDAIRAHNTNAVSAALSRDARVINARARAGTTPLMYAATYGELALLRTMLEAGGDPNIRDDAGATALMWAIDDVAKVKVLLDRGADPNARSGHGRTPLLLAAGQLDSHDVIQLLLERGANMTTGALTASAARGNLRVVRMLLKAGARESTDAAVGALRASCFDCIEAIGAVQPITPLRGALLNLFPPGAGHPDAVRAALRLGADVNAKDTQSRTVLMKAVFADGMPSEIIRLLINGGADVTVKTPDGLTALDFARRVGNPAIIEALVKAGAIDRRDEGAEPAGVVRNNSRTAAISRSLPLLQKTAVEFYRKSGCVSCHHNALTAMTVAAARAQRFVVNEDLRMKELATVVGDALAGHDALMQGLVPFGGGPPTIGYILLGLAAEHHAADIATDAMVRLLRLSQLPDGHWSGANRPPLEASEFTYTAVNLRGIQQFQSPACETCGRAIERAIAWLSHSKPDTTEDRVFRLFGLAWGRAARRVVQTAIEDVIASQRSDGGWAQLPSLPSDAYATGEALVALHEAGVSAKAPAYQRGVDFLLRTQLQDGSWFVRKRAHPTQPYFESGFPHGVNQFISTAATNWATLALIAAR
jgi:ankyrin repeat protein